MFETMIAIPAYDNKINGPLAETLIRLCRKYPERYGVIVHGGRASLSLVRDEIVATFLKSDCTQLLMIDTDVICFEEHINQLCNRVLLKTEERPEMISACVPPRGLADRVKKRYVGELEE